MMLDLFSGQPNPSVEITREDFDDLYGQVVSQKPLRANLFDGLGFRGIVVTNNFGTYISIQNKILQIETANTAQQFISNTKLIKHAFAVFKKYDTSKTYASMIPSLLKEFGIG